MPDSIVWLTLDKPGTSANVLSSGVLTELDSVLEPLVKAPPRAVIVISGKKSGFIAGADIKEFTDISNVEDGYRLIRAGQDVLNRLEALPCPTVAAIHGFALGGGFELALACQYRVAVDDEKLSLGFPEVQLGIHPGFGGTVRSVRLVGVRPAMEMMLTGRPFRADKALRIGLVDKLVAAQDLRKAAKELALQAPTPTRAPFGERVLSWPIVRGFVKGTLVCASGRKSATRPLPGALRNNRPLGAQGDRLTRQKHARLRSSS